MLFHRSHLTLAAACFTLLACADTTPTGPALATVDAQASAKGGNRPGARLTGEVDQTIAGTVLDATVRVTRLTQSATGGLLASGVLSGTANGIAFTQTFTDVPATLSSAGDMAMAAAGDVTTQAIGGECDILYLDLGPLHLDLLGLNVDLARVVLDIYAQAGAGNLVGNLLCAVVHLLDGPGLFSAIANLLDQINSILAAF